MPYNTKMEMEDGRFIWPLQGYNCCARGGDYKSPCFNTGTIKWQLLLIRIYHNIVFRLKGEYESAIARISVHLNIDVISAANASSVNLVRTESDAKTNRWNEIIVCEEVEYKNILPEYLANNVLTLRFCVATEMNGKFNVCSLTASKLESSIESLHSDIASYRLTHDSGDVVLRADQQQFLVHKFILASRSPVFRSMFAENDKLEYHTVAVSITDVSAPVLTHMINYMYGQEVDDSLVGVDLYAASVKYCMQDLKLRCARGLERSLTVEKVCEVASMAKLHQDIQLLTSAKIFISSHVAQVLCTKGWVELAAKEPALASDIAVFANTDL